jgi:TonB-dependent receptor
MELWALSATAGAAVLMLMASGAAQAQAVTPPAGAASAAAAQADEPTQTVVVTGIRKGIEDAISVKKNSDEIVEAVSAEDIGKLPDVSIAESLARLPGLAAQRVAGRAQVVSVRGMSPDFSTTLLNGREMVSTGDNRSAEFDQYPSELMSGVTVYKTPSAALVGQGLSATIDMQTVRPLNFHDRVVALNARAERNSLGAAANTSANGKRFSVSYIDQFADRTVGVLLGYAHLDTPKLENQVGLYEPWKTDGRPGLPAGTYASDGIKAFRRSGDDKRDGLMATVEWRPSKNLTSTLDLYHSQFKEVDTANQFEVNLSGYNGINNPTPDQTFGYSNVTIDNNNTFVGGTAANVYPLVRGMYNHREDKIDAVGWNNRFKLGEQTLVTDVSYSKAKRDELNLENNTQLQPSPQLDTLQLNYATGGFPTIHTGLDYSNPNDLLVSNTIYGSGYGKVPHVDDELRSIKVADTIPMPESMSGTISDVQVGVNYADREKHKTQPEGSINLGAQGPTAIPSDLQYAPVNLGFAGLGTIPAWNVPGVVDRFMVFAPTDTQSYLISKAWNVYEKITTGFVQADLDSQWFGLPVRGNAGLQLQHVDQSSTANFFNAAASGSNQIVPITGGKKFTDVLPSLNLAFDLGGDQTLRFAAAKQVARPRVDQLRAARDFGIGSDGSTGASGGNPELDPWRAYALDLSYEKYFGKKAYFSAAGFYKDLTSYIYTQSINPYDFSSYLVGYVPPQGAPAAKPEGTLSIPLNGKGGKLEGLELTLSMPLNLLTPSLDGFGIVASAGLTNSSIKTYDPDSATSVGSGPIAMPGLSKKVAELTAYYERAGFEARISERRRSDFIGEIGNFAGNRTLRYVEGESIVDAQVGYNFNDGALKGLGLLFQVNNLTNAPYKTYAQQKDRPLEYSEWGTSYLLGATYKF